MNDDPRHVEALRRLGEPLLADGDPTGHEWAMRFRELMTEWNELRYRSWDGPLSKAERRRLDRLGDITYMADWRCRWASLEQMRRKVEAIIGKPIDGGDDEPKADAIGGEG